MPLIPPETLSPSKVANFTKCALAFRYSAIDKLYEPPSEAATKGTLVHAALERLYALDANDRTRQAAIGCLDAAIESMRDEEDFTELELDEAAEEDFFADAATLLGNYFAMEDPRQIHPIGLEIKLEIPRDGYSIRGIIDRLELDDDGELIVTDYKSGRAPPERFAHGRLDGVNIYATMCTELFGKRPAKVQLLYLRDKTVISDTPTDQSLRGMSRKVDAVWQAVERSCATGDFRPKPSRLCDWCAFQAHCPAFGGEVLAPPETPGDS